MVKALHGKSNAQLQNITCHMESHNVSCHPTQVNALCLNPSQSGRYSIYLSRWNERL